jgi:ABC-type multidrug transport system ATPase subunit
MENESCVSFKNFTVDLILNKSSNNKYRSLLSPINTTVNSGKLFAILGGSGSGKTTLLNIISGRYNVTSYRIGGELTFNGKKSCHIGYVTQQDYLLPFLTVYETLLFAAKMRTPANNKTKTEKSIRNEDIVRDVILNLGLKECSNNIIGDDLRVNSVRGLSGGEKRRVSIAIQILFNPEGSYKLSCFNLFFVSTKY